VTQETNFTKGITLFGYGKNTLCLGHKELKFDGFSGKGHYCFNSSLENSRGEE
jgi:hypothetical protein